MKRTINQLVTAIMALEGKPLTFDSEKLLRRLRAEHDRKTIALGEVTQQARQGRGY